MMVQEENAKYAEKESQLLVQEIVQKELERITILKTE